MDRRSGLEVVFKEHGYSDFKWIKPKDIVVANWVRMKCAYGCATYGRNASCPPNVPSVSECRQFFDEYSTAAIFHFAHSLEKPEDRREWGREIDTRLLKLERDVFLSGYPKTFLLFADICRLCNGCRGDKDYSAPGSARPARERVQCKNPKSARPTPEAMAVDVFSTASQCGYPIEVLTDYAQQMNRYALLLIE
jgi:predicted metal-binding protein